MGDVSVDENDLHIEDEGILDGETNITTSNEALSEDPDVEALRNRMKEIEEEAQMIKKLQNDVEKQMNMSTTSSGSLPPQLSLEEKMEADSRSVYVGNQLNLCFFAWRGYLKEIEKVDYGTTAQELAAHFHGCGCVNRVTILTDKFSGHPKGFAYIEFADKESVQTALQLDESLFRGRQIKVSAKRTNKPGVSTTNRPPRGRGRGAPRVIVKYIYGGYRGARSRPPRRRSAMYTQSY